MFFCLHHDYAHKALMKKALVDGTQCLGYSMVTKVYHFFYKFLGTRVLINPIAAFVIGLSLFIKQSFIDQCSMILSRTQGFYVFRKSNRLQFMQPCLQTHISIMENKL